ncbi:hypothetical protein [Abyssisolibacter fermentans]|uniref:hypothetical protein n=1 Tax=Abyssisolibacter fermentans TaxID=1766203 RepID=UPI0008303D8D|nr:hypothetical protein [Abyssisolibacter fermentans]
MKDKNNLKNQKATNGYDIIIDSYNKYKYPIIENQMNALVFPWKLQNGTDMIDSMKFCSEELNEEFKNMNNIK